MGTGNPAWSETQTWLREAPNTVEILPGDRKRQYVKSCVKEQRLVELEMAVTS